LTGSTSSGKGLAAIIVFCVIFLFAAASAVYFYLDASQAALAIEEIDNTEYEDITAEKTKENSVNGQPLTAQITESVEQTEYQTPLGFSIISYSPEWTGDKLIEIYDELLKNGHGDEIGYLSHITLYPGKPDYGDDMDAAGERTDADFDPYVYVDVPMLIPPGARYNTNITASDISIYYMNDYDDASEVAETLAHEYGHHYTMYYFMQNDDAAKESEYYALRNIEALDHEVFYDDWNTYYENHMWDIYEIAAEDYVQLLGSPDAKQTMEYMDGKDLLNADMDSYNPDVRGEFVNIFPQENIFIPLADEIPGLRDYYYSFINLENEYDTPLETVDFNLQIEKKSSYGHRYYNITWTMVNTDPDVLYTLVCYDSNGDLFRPVRTVYGNEKPIARVGSPTITSGNWIYWWNDYITKEDRIFKLYMLLPDGRMIASEPFYKKF
jgi:hypothetical protein